MVNEQSNWPEGQRCKSCAFWTPKYYGVGQCIREGHPGAKMWVTENKELLTVGEFGCPEHEACSDPRKETL